MGVNLGVNGIVPFSFTHGTARRRLPIMIRRDCSDADGVAKGFPRPGEFMILCALVAYRQPLLRSDYTSPSALCFLEILKTFLGDD